MNQLRFELIQLITLIIVEICKHDKVCKAEPIDKKKILSKIKNIKIDSDFTYDNLLDIIKSIQKQIKDKDVSYKIIDCLNALKAYLKDPDKKKWIKVVGLYSEIKKDVSNIFTQYNKFHKESIKRDVLLLKKIVKKYGKENRPDNLDFVLSLNEVKLLKEKNPDVLLKYTTTFNHLLEQAKKFIQYLILKNGQHKLPIDQIAEEMKKQGFPPIYHDQVVNYIYLDLNFNLYAYKKTKLSCKPPIYRVLIEYNKSYNKDDDSNYVLKYMILGGATWQFCYSEQYKQKMNEEKYSKVYESLDKIDQVRKKWLKDIKSDDKIKQQLGAATEIIYQTAMRVGTKGNQTNGEPTYGLLTLKVLNVKCDETKGIVEFTYIGKAGVSHHHKIKNKDITKIICNLIKNKKKQDRLFDITPEQLNKYLKERLKLPITIHKFRTIKGTLLAYKKLIQENPCKNMKTDKEKLEYLRKVLIDIGKELGHYSGEKITGETALKNYIDPNIIKEYYETCNLKMNKKIKQLIGLEFIDNVPEDYPGWPGTYDNEYVIKKLTHYTKYF